MSRMKGCARFDAPDRELYVEFVDFNFTTLSALSRRQPIVRECDGRISDPSRQVHWLICECDPIFVPLQAEFPASSILQAVHPRGRLRFLTEIPITV